MHKNAVSAMHHYCSSNATTAAAISYMATPSMHICWQV